MQSLAYGEPRPEASEELKVCMMHLQGHWSIKNGAIQEPSARKIWVGIT